MLSILVDVRRCNVRARGGISSRDTSGGSCTARTERRFRPIRLALVESNWTADVTSHLMDRSACPRCGIRALELGWCRNCGADLSTPVAQEIWESSIAAVRAIEHRQQLIGTLTEVKATAAAATQPPPPGRHRIRCPAARRRSRRLDAAAVPAAVSAGASSQLSVQSVLAVAGAGLFAVAAIVFTFFNPDIDYATRTTIIAIVTALFLGGAWFFASRGLRFSAEAVGALGMVFLALDVWAFADAAPDGVNGWAFAGIGTLVASSLMIAVAALVRLRVWLWLSHHRTLARRGVLRLCHRELVGCDRRPPGSRVCGARGARAREAPRRTLRQRAHGGSGHRDDRAVRRRVPGDRRDRLRPAAGTRRRGHALDLRRRRSARRPRPARGAEHPQRGGCRLERPCRRVRGRRDRNPSARLRGAAVGVGVRAHPARRRRSPSSRSRSFDEPGRFIACRCSSERCRSRWRPSSRRRVSPSGASVPAC